jgi:hypothetical protein
VGRGEVSAGGVAVSLDTGWGIVRSGLKAFGVGVCAVPQMEGEEPQADMVSDAARRMTKARFTGMIISVLIKSA